MCKQNIKRYRQIILQPHWSQFVINELPMMLAAGCSFVYGGMEDMYLHRLGFIASLLLSLRLLYLFIELRRMEYRVGDEQLVFEHGVFTRHSDYMELYRIVDFNEHRSLMQQIFGLKTVTIYSGDRNTPTLDVVGVRNSLDLVSLIRERVEFNKQRKGVYEITNR